MMDQLDYALLADSVVAMMVTSLVMFVLNTSLTNRGWKLSKVFMFDGSLMIFACVVLESLFDSDLSIAFWSMSAAFLFLSLLCKYQEHKTKQEREMYEREYG